MVIVILRSQLRKMENRRKKWSKKDMKGSDGELF
jgi:hypothetical protein